MIDAQKTKKQKIIVHAPSSVWDEKSDEETMQLVRKGQTIILGEDVGDKIFIDPMPNLDNPQDKVVKGEKERLRKQLEAELTGSGEFDDIIFGGDPVGDDAEIVASALKEDGTNEITTINNK